MERLADEGWGPQVCAECAKAARKALHKAVRKSPRQELGKVAKDVALINHVKAFAGQKLALLKDCSRSSEMASAQAFKVLGEIDEKCRELGAAQHADAVDVFLSATIFVRATVAERGLLPRRRARFKDVSRSDRIIPRSEGVSVSACESERESEKSASDKRASASRERERAECESEREQSESESIRSERESVQGESEIESDSDSKRESEHERESES